MTGNKRQRSKCKPLMDSRHSTCHSRDWYIFAYIYFFPRLHLRSEHKQQGSKNNCLFPQLNSSGWIHYTEVSWDVIIGLGLHYVMCFHQFGKVVFHGNLLLEYLDSLSWYYMVVGRLYISDQNDFVRERNKSDLISVISMNLNHVLMSCGSVAKK